MSNWIQTYTNKKFFPLDPNPKDINIEDIAHSLSNKCRFSGHVDDYYSVAQHSVLVSRCSSKEDRLWGLLHDASEAYLVDMPKPLKVLPEFQWFVDVENKLQEIIVASFGLDIIQPDSVHKADKELLLAEKRDLVKYRPVEEWQIRHDDIKPYPKKIIPMLPKEAEKFFLEEFLMLTSSK